MRSLISSSASSASNCIIPVANKIVPLASIHPDADIMIRVAVLRACRRRRSVQKCRLWGQVADKTSPGGRNRWRMVAVWSSVGPICRMAIVSRFSVQLAVICASEVSASFLHILSAIWLVSGTARELTFRPLQDSHAFASRLLFGASPEY